MTKELFTLLYPDSITPSRATEKSAGYDLYFHHMEERPGNPRTAFIHTGVAVNIPEGHFGVLAPRSSISAKFNLGFTNGVGIIDEDYGREIICMVIGHDIGPSQIKADLREGDRIGQIVFLPYYTQPDEPIKVKRKGGIGSTGK